MAQPNGSDWPLPDLEVFVYDPVDESGSQNEAMLGMLRCRYSSGSEQPDSDRVLPRPLRRIRIGNDRAQGPYLLREAEMILPKAETSLIESYQISTW
ncbi:hypothetical protein M407DRAFT_241118 [Tulasnella calospora MUT 4182]|uniref:Uncharacterized protein n=1 Tax=Tulasnella calospora MUT 4182 TaxID=1051891 RepID=A0A0C3QL15_9AGAM|nr:hypothetical protein M407DRAFT_241118 [Tulasnella calospora MUT 4182]